MALALENGEKSVASEMLVLIRDKENFEQNKNIIIEFLHKNEGIEKAEQLQNKFTTEAVSLLSQLPNSEDLIDFTEMIGRRKF